MIMVQTFNEFKVVYSEDEDGKVIIIDKKLSDRKQVRISEQTAKVNNYYTHSTGLLYEVDKEQTDSKSPERVKLEDKANALEINFKANIGDAKLLEKIKTIEPNYK